MPWLDDLFKFFILLPPHNLVIFLIVSKLENKVHLDQPDAELEEGGMGFDILYFRS